MSNKMHYATAKKLCADTFSLAEKMFIEECAADLPSINREKASQIATHCVSVASLFVDACVEAEEGIMDHFRPPAEPEPEQEPEPKNLEDLK